MTKEEALIILRKHNEWRRYDGPIGEGPEMQSPTELGKAIDVAIEGLSKPSLPSGLDEAAEKYADESCFDDPEFTATKLSFKAGAEWMAGQGVKATATVGYYNQCGLSILTEPSIKKLGFKEGDELEITIRKK